jgi:hypothetical protein
MMLLSLEFSACTQRRTISDFWGQADTPSGAGKRLQMIRGEHPQQNLPRAVKTPGNEPTCPEPSKLVVPGRPDPEGSVLRL